MRIDNLITVSETSYIEQSRIDENQHVAAFIGLTTKQCIEIRHNCVSYTLSTVS